MEATMNNGTANIMDTEMGGIRRWVTAKECAEYFAVSVEFIRRLTQAGEIPAMRIRGLARYDLDAVERTFLQNGMPEDVA